MFKRKRKEFQCFKGKRRKSNVPNDKEGIPMFKRIRGEFQCLKGKGRKSNV